VSRVDDGANLDWKRRDAEQVLPTFEIIIIFAAVFLWRERRFRRASAAGCLAEKSRQALK
jgi:hypothetical protein